MSSILKQQRILIHLLILGILLSSPAAAAPEYLRYYKTGLDAAETKDWSLVDQMMRQAIERRPKEKQRRIVRRTGYYPHFYLGLARYHLGDCSGALASWSESESQGAIVGRDEYADLLRLRSDCQKNGAPSVAGTSSEAASRPPRNGKTAKEQVRTGQRFVESGADPARKSLTVVEGVAPEGSELSKVATRGQKVVDAAETATDIVDLALSPTERLESAVDAYFAGNPDRTLEMLRDIDLSDPRARAQVYLFRAAANFRLHRIAGQDEARLAEARKNASLFKREQWSDDFPTEFFDPLFVRFLRGGP